MGDLLRPDSLPAKLAAARQHFELICRGAGKTPESTGMRSWRTSRRSASASAPGSSTPAPCSRQRWPMALRSSSREPRRRCWTSITGPTLSSPRLPLLPAACAPGLGVSPTRIDAVLGIVKAYTTRVGAGPLPTEMGGALEEEIRKRGGEFGASTGRPRRCGWFDAVICATPRGPTDSTRWRS